VKLLASLTGCYSCPSSKHQTYPRLGSAVIWNCNYSVSIRTSVNSDVQSRADDVTTNLWRTTQNTWIEHFISVFSLCYADLATLFRINAFCRSLPIIWRKIQRNRKEVRLAVFMLMMRVVVMIQVAVFCVLMPCSDVVGYHRFGGPYYLHLQGPKCWCPRTSLRGVKIQKTVTQKKLCSAEDIFVLPVRWLETLHCETVVNISVRLSVNSKSPQVEYRPFYEHRYRSSQWHWYQHKHFIAEW
jgi:hypothetical protein